MPPYGLPSYGIKTPQHILRHDASYFNEKILIEPDMDARTSMEKALPGRPTTPKTVMKRLRFTALLSFALGVVAFVLALLLVLAGKNPGQLEDEYLIKLNTSHAGENIIQFERASATTTASPTATTTQASNPLDPLGIFATNSPLNPFNSNNPLSGPLNNLTDSINDGLGDAVNAVIKEVVDQVGVRDFYYVYVNHICVGDFTNGTGGNSDGVQVTKCSTWDQAKKDLQASIPKIQSAITIANTRVAIPILGAISSGGNSIIKTISVSFKVSLAFLIIVTICAGLVTLISLPAVFFSASRLLVYANLFFSAVAQTFALIAAIIVTALSILVSFLSGRITEAVSVFIIKGNAAVAFLWVIWALTFILTSYWGAVWFVEVRKSAFVRRRRSNGEVGNWRGIFGEIRRNLKGEKEF